MNAPRLGLNGLPALAMLVLAPCVSLAQQQPSVPAPPPNGVVLSGGLGVGSLDGLAAQFSLAVPLSGGDLIGRAAGTSEFTIFGTSETSQDIAVLYGRRSSGSKGWVRAAGGLGVAYGVRRGEQLPGACFFGCSYEQERHSTLGLAVQVDAVWAPISSLGLGLSLFGNLNQPGPFGGVTLNLYLGQVR